MDGLGHSNSTSVPWMPTKEGKRNALLASGATILTSDPTVAAR